VSTANLAECPPFLTREVIAMFDAVGVSKRIVSARVFTPTSCITCDFHMRQCRLSDFLNETEEPFIMVDNVRVVCLDDAQARPRLFPYTQLNRDLIVFAIPYAGESLAEGEYEKRLLYVNKQPYRVTLNAPPFLFYGNLHFIKEVGLRDALLAVRLPFLPMTDAVAIHLPTGQRYRGDTLIVNRARIETFSPTQPGEEEIGTDYLFRSR